MYAFVEPDIQPKPQINPCVPSPCGPNSVCRDQGGVPACSCLKDYIGRPPNCRPECTINSECEGHLACQNDHCIDPCPGSCGVNAQCVVVHHTPVCTCEQGYTGDPFSVCSLIIERKNVLHEIINKKQLTRSLQILTNIFSLHVVV